MGKKVNVLIIVLAVLFLILISYTIKQKSGSIHGYSSLTPQGVTQYTLCSSGCDFSDLTSALFSINGTNSSISIEEAGAWSVNGSYVFRIKSVCNANTILTGQDNIIIDLNNSVLYGSGNNCGSGIRIQTDNVTLRNFEVEGYKEGLYVNISEKLDVYNGVLNNNTQGIYVLAGDEIQFENIYSYNNSKGFVATVSPKITIINSNISENTYQDLSLEDVNIRHCNSDLLSLENVTGSGGRPIGFYSTSINISNREFSELILCGADNSKFENLTIEGSDRLKNNGLFIYATDNSYFKNINSSGNFYGIYTERINNNYINNVTTNFNSQNGIYMDHDSFNRLDSIISNFNSINGIYMDGNTNNTLSNITANSNHGTGIFEFGSIDHDNIFDSVHVESNNQGIRFGGENNKVNRLTAINNWFGIVLLGSTQITNSAIYDNHEDLSFASNPNCNYAYDFENVTGPGGRLIEVYSNSVNISNQEFSALILCNADNSKLENITVTGGGPLGVYYTDNSYFKNINSSGNFYGLQMVSSSNNTFANLIVNNNNAGILMVAYGFYKNKNNTVMGLTSHSNKNCVLLDSFENSILSSFDISNCKDRGINFGSVIDSSFTNGVINRATFGLYVYSPTNSTFRDIELINASLWTYSASHSPNVSELFINVSYNDEYIVGPAISFIRKWYVDINVKDISVGNLADAEISVYNSSGSLVLSSQTDSFGNSRIELIEYTTKGRYTKHYQENYTITAEKSGYTNSTNISLYSNIAIELSLPVASDTGDGGNNNRGGSSSSRRQDDSTNLNGTNLTGNYSTNLSGQGDTENYLDLLGGIENNLNKKNILRSILFFLITAILIAFVIIGFVYHKKKKREQALRNLIENPEYSEGENQEIPPQNNSFREDEELN